MQVLGILFLLIAGVTTYISQRAHKPATGLALWVVYVFSIVAGIALVAS